MIREQHDHRYEIRVRGHLGRTLLGAFADMDAETREDDTLLTGILMDQPALHGILAQIESLGLELLEVRRLPDGPSRSNEINRSRNHSCAEDC